MHDPDMISAFETAMIETELLALKPQSKNCMHITVQCFYANSSTTSTTISLNILPTNRN